MGNSQFGNNVEQIENKIKTSVYKTHVYKTSVSEQEGENIVKIRDGYYKNKKGIFYDGQNLNLLKIEKNTFKKLKYSYAKSKNYVFYKGTVIPDADPKTFIVINRKNMPEEFKIFNSVIGMDFKNGTRRIYQFGNKILSNVV
jgi:hypothetical protein